MHKRQTEDTTQPKFAYVCGCMLAVGCIACLRLAFQQGCQGQGCASLVRHAQGQRLDAPLQQEAGVGVQGASQVRLQAQDLRAGSPQPAVRQPCRPVLQPHAAGELAGAEAGVCTCGVRSSGSRAGQGCMQVQHGLLHLAGRGLTPVLALLAERPGADLCRSLQHHRTVMHAHALALSAMPLQLQCHTRLIKVQHGSWTTVGQCASAHLLNVVLGARIDPSNDI